MKYAHASVGWTMGVLFSMVVQPMSAEANSVLWSRVVADGNAVNADDDTGAPVTGDLDGDGDHEILAVFSGTETLSPTQQRFNTRVSAWHHTGQPVNGWPVTLSTTQGWPVISTLAVGNIDGDARNESEVIFGYRIGTPQGPPEKGIRVHRADGTTYLDIVWEPLKADFAPVVADLDGDGSNDIVAIGSSAVGAWDKNGAFLPGWPAVFTGAATESPTVADIDGDGDLEIVAVAANDFTATVHAWHHNGAPVSGWPVSLQAIPGALQAPPLVGDFTGTGDPLVMVLAPLHLQIRAYFLDGVGNVVNSVSTKFFPQNLHELGYVTPALANVNRDSMLEVLVAGGSNNASPAGGWLEHLLAFPHTLPPTPGDAFVSDVYALGQLRASPVVITATDSKRRSRSLSYGVGDDGRLYRWTEGRGGVLKDLRVSHPLSPIVEDLDGDGNLELVVVGRRARVGRRIMPDKSRISVIDLLWQGAPLVGKAEWSTFKGNPQRTGSHQR